MDNFKSIVTICESADEKKKIHQMIRKSLPYSLFRTVYDSAYLSSKLKWGKVDIVIISSAFKEKRESLVREVAEHSNAFNPIIIFLDNSINITDAIKESMITGIHLDIFTVSDTVDLGEYIFTLFNEGNVPKHQ